MTKTRSLSALCLAVLASTLVAACDKGAEEVVGDGVGAAPSCLKAALPPVKLPGGTFMMGQDEVYAEEQPRHQRSVGEFWIDAHEVTNAQFAEFVDQTGYVTRAEKPGDPTDFGVPADQIPPELLLPGSPVFTPPSGPPGRGMDWWRFVPGAYWKKPYGPDGADAADLEPVVHLTLADMEAYAEWKGGRLPTEAEWEYAAAAGQEPVVDQPAGDQANSWQGVFPYADEGSDGFTSIAPVGCFAANKFGLYDMVGNVWEVARGAYSPQGHKVPVSSPQSGGPTQREENSEVLMKGGSYLCAPNYCMRYRPQSRQPRDPSIGASNVGFRLVYDYLEN